jgi:hypothetical protein
VTFILNFTISPGSSFYFDNSYAANISSTLGNNSAIPNVTLVVPLIPISPVVVPFSPPSPSVVPGATPLPDQPNVADSTILALEIAVGASGFLLLLCLLLLYIQLRRRKRAAVAVAWVNEKGPIEMAHPPQEVSRIDVLLDMLKDDEATKIARKKEAERKAAAEEAARLRVIAEAEAAQRRAAEEAAAAEKARYPGRGYPGRGYPGRGGYPGGYPGRAYPPPPGPGRGGVPRSGNMADDLRALQGSGAFVPVQNPVQGGRPQPPKGSFGGR